MPTISPFLDDLLTRWTQRATDIRKDVASQKEALDAAAITLMGTRLAIGEQRRQDGRDLQTLISKLRMPRTDQADTLLQKLQALKPIASQVGEIERLLQGSRWMQKAHSHADTIGQRLEAKAQFLQEKHHQFHDTLAGWSSELQQRLIQLQEFKDREAAKGERVYVSRARKQPEIDFVRHHRELEHQLKLELQDLRKALNHALSRIHKMSWTLTQRTSQNPDEFNALQKELSDRLGMLEKVFYERRDEILSDALLFEAGRRHLQTADEVVRAMPCVEDTAAPSFKSAWAKFLN